MCKKIVITVLAFAALLPFHADGGIRETLSGVEGSNLSLKARTGNGIPEVLKSVEENNISLKAQRQSAESKSYEARMGNSPGDLSVSYAHLWGRDAAAGETGELEVTQSFDFPTVYADRSRVAKALARQYDNEYVALRQQLLLQAKELCIEMYSLRQTESIMLSRLDANEYLRRVYSDKFEAGDATLLDMTRINNEYLLLQEKVSECSLRMVEIRRMLTVLNGGQPLDLNLGGSTFGSDGRLSNPDKAGTTAVAFEPMDELKPFENVYADYREYDPQLLALRLQENTREQEVKLSRAQALPKFELGYKHEFAPGEKFNGVVAGISIPIFSNRYNVKRAKAAQAAAKFETGEAEAEAESILVEMYEKAALLARSLGLYDTMPDSSGYIGMLVRMLESGSINVVDYYAELYAFYDVAEARIRIEKEYRTLLARINMVYL